MKSKAKVIFLILFLLIKMELILAQYISNPSFEDTPHANIPPMDWAPCHSLSTPDTGPGFWNCYTNPSDGQSYMMMITRGPLGPYANTWEDCETKFDNNLQKGESYSYSIDLARSDSWGHDTWEFGWISYTTPVLLRFWCGNNSCSRAELLFQIGPIDHTDWRTYNFSLNPSLMNCNYLILEAYYDHFPEYFGNVLLDNIKYNPEFSIPNIITPNGDTKNDEFIIQNLPSGYPLKIFNRWGNLIYQHFSYDNSWPGQDISDGIYYYILGPSKNNKDNKIWEGYVQSIK